MPVKHSILLPGATGEIPRVPIDLDGLPEPAFLRPAWILAMTALALPFHGIAAFVAASYLGAWGVVIGASTFSAHYVVLASAAFEIWDLAPRPRPRPRQRPDGKPAPVFPPPER